jgi:hypothetical protein
MRQGWQLSKNVNCPQKIRLAIISWQHVVRNGIGTDMSDRCHKNGANYLVILEQ